MTWLVSIQVCMYVSMYVSMSRLANHTLKLNQTLNIIIGYAVDLSFHEFHLRGQTNVAFV